MDFTFLTHTGEIAFVRSDAQVADWTQEELNLNCTFPYDPKKVIERGMTVLFQNSATGDWQAYEIRQCSIYPGEYYQQFTAEDIAVAELSDVHISAQKTELTKVTPKAALEKVLEGTKWNVGTVEVKTKSSGDISRGTAWNGVNTIVQNWNVYIMPRVTVNVNGIKERFLDILSPEGTDRGLRLAINKNVTDPCVTYDDSELYTALYGYGGTYKDDKSESQQYDFSSVVWEKTSDHPAKAKGKKYLEYPEMTALYGRNGKPRYGYYQNTSIKDPEILLQKTWESLKLCCQPKISIEGTVSDLYRMGYKDVPLQLHDLAIIELEPVGILVYKQIIKLTVNLLDPTKNLPTIGDYIPNIIYINRDTNDHATGGGGGGGTGPSTMEELQDDEYQTSLNDDGRRISLNAAHIDEHGKIFKQAGMYIDPDTGVLIYAEDNKNMVGSKFHVMSDKIESEVTDRKKADSSLSSRITQTATDITLEVKRATKAEGDLSGQIKVEAGNITAEVKRAKDAEGELSGRLTITEGAITAEVTNRTNADNALSGRIDVQAGRIDLVVTGTGDNAKVNSASIVLGINGQSGSYVKIKADTINLSGYVTISELNATDAKIDNLTSGAATANTLKTILLSASTGFTYQGHSISFKTVTVGTNTYYLLGR